MSMSGYTKLFNSILASTVWREPNHVRILWITLLAMADKHGMVEGSVPGIADFARISVQECRDALQSLQQPDPDSRTKEHEGRRIFELDGGWQIINHNKYRDKLGKDERREYLKVKQREYRRRQQESTNVNNVSDKLTLLTHPEASPSPSPSPQERKNRGGSSVTTAPTVNSGPAPLGNRSEHRNHAMCGRVCLHSTQFADFVKRASNKPDPDTYVREFFRTVNTRYTTGERKAELISADGFDFWREQWVEVHPRTTGRRKSDDTELQESIAKQKAEIAKGEARRKAVGL